MYMRSPLRLAIGGRIGRSFGAKFDFGISAVTIHATQMHGFSGMHTGGIRLSVAGYASMALAVPFALRLLPELAFRLRKRGPRRGPNDPDAQRERRDCAQRCPT